MRFLKFKICIAIHLMVYLSHGQIDYNLHPMFTEKMVLVNIGKLNRNQIAKLIEKIQVNGPKVIGVGAWFSQKKEDDSLITTLYKYRNIVLSIVLKGCSMATLTCNGIEESYFPYSHKGQVVTMEDQNKVIRKFIPVLKYRDEFYPHYAIKILELYDTTLVADFFEHVANYDIDFVGNYDSFLSFEGSDILKGPSLHRLVFKDKIILLGYLGERIGQFANPYDEEDLQYSPLGDQKAPDMYGVVVVANIIYTILRQLPKR